MPDLLPGEDRNFGTGLFVDLVPSTCWFTNVRTCVSPQDWERLRRRILRRAGQACEACGATEDRAARLWLEAHERWHYDPRAGSQTLRRLICLCSPCHLVTHFGHANVTGRTEEAFAHLRAVTGMSQDQAWAHVRSAEVLWIERSRRVWELDLSMLTTAGVRLQRPDRAADRPAAAARALRREQIRPAANIPRQRTTRPRPVQSAVAEPSTPPSSVPARSEPEPHAEPRAQRSFWAWITGKA